MKSIVILVTILALAGCQSENVDTASEFLASGQYEEARDCLRNELATFPDDLDALLLLGEVELRDGNLNHAEDGFQQAIRIDSRCGADIAQRYFRTAKWLWQEEGANADTLVITDLLQSAFVYDDRIDGEINKWLEGEIGSASDPPVLNAISRVVRGFSDSLPEAKERLASFSLKAANDQANQGNWDLAGELAHLAGDLHSGQLEEAAVVLLRASVALDEREAGILSTEFKQNASKWNPLLREEDVLSDSLRQERTVKAIKNIGAAMIAWHNIQMKTNRGNQDSASASGYGNPSAHETVKSLLVPEYISTLPSTDGWGHPYEFYLRTDDLIAPELMLIRSPGRDGVFSSDLRLLGEFQAGAFDEDIVWADGFFLRWPED